MNPFKKLIKKPVNTKTILIVTVILMAMFLSFALFEFFSSRQDLVSMLNDEGLLLLDALVASSERSILSYDELEQSMQDRLVNSARWIEETDYREGLTQEFVDRFASRMDLYRIHILDGSGQIVMSNTIPHAEQGFMRRVGQDAVVRQFLSDSPSDTLVIGFREGQMSGESRYEVVVRRRNGGGIAVAADADQLFALRRELGPGRLIQEIGDNPGIGYVVLQDTLGVLLASRGVEEITSIPGDPFLIRIYTEQSRGSRFSPYKGIEMFEIVGSFMLEEDHLGIFRIGLETEYYRNILRNARFRLFLISLIFIIVGIIGFSFVLANQNVKLLSDSYNRVKMHTSEILQNMKDGVIAVDHEGRITVFNRAAEILFSISQNQAAGQRIQSLDIPSLSVLKESFTTGLPIDLPKEEFIIQDQKRVLSMRTSVVKHNKNEIDTVILVVTDLTAQSRLEEKVRRQEKLSTMGKLASEVAHEIRNPINAIHMIGQRLLKEFRPQDDQEEYKGMMNTVVQETKRVNEIVQRFLRFAKPPPLQLSSVSVSKLFGEIDDLMRSSVEARGIDLEMQIDVDATLTMDRSQMKQVLVNLIQNGLDFTPEGGSIHVTGCIADRTYLISVADTGSGIGKSHLDKIFDLYYTTKKEGTGMGLPIVYQIIQNHGGEVVVESRKNRGTVFTIRFPMEGNG